MPLHTLIAHPITPPKAAFGLTARVTRAGRTGVQIRYRVEGDIAALRLAEKVSQQRKDELWKTTCFEAFVALPQGYCEYNFAPSTHWAAYRFSDYRDGMADLDDMAPPSFDQQLDGKLYQCDVTFDLPEVLARQSTHINLTAVIEEKDGTKSYWALKHPDGPPDFHDPACFILPLKAPDAA